MSTLIKFWEDDVIITPRTSPERNFSITSIKLLWAELNINLAVQNNVVKILIPKK